MINFLYYCAGAAGFATGLTIYVIMTWVFRR